MTYLDQSEPILDESKPITAHPSHRGWRDMNGLLYFTILPPDMTFSLRLNNPVTLLQWKMCAARVFSCLNRVIRGNSGHSMRDICRHIKVKIIFVIERLGFSILLLIIAYICHNICLCINTHFQCKTVEIKASEFGIMATPGNPRAR